MPLNVMGRSEVVYMINCANCETNSISKTGKNWRHDFMNTSVKLNDSKIGPKFGYICWKRIIGFTMKTLLLLLRAKVLMNETWFSKNISINQGMDLHPAYQILMGKISRGKPPENRTRINQQTGLRNNFHTTVDD